MLDGRGVVLPRLHCTRLCEEEGGRQSLQQTCNPTCVGHTRAPFIHLCLDSFKFLSNLNKIKVCNYIQWKQTYRDDANNITYSTCIPYLLQLESEFIDTGASLLVVLSLFCQAVL